jgi:hypothetical protein
MRGRARGKRMVHVELLSDDHCLQVVGAAGLHGERGETEHGCPVCPLSLGVMDSPSNVSPPRYLAPSSSIGLPTVDGTVYGVGQGLEPCLNRRPHFQEFTSL